MATTHPWADQPAIEAVHPGAILSAAYGGNHADAAHELARRGMSTPSSTAGAMVFDPVEVASAQSECGDHAVARQTLESVPADHRDLAWQSASVLAHARAGEGDAAEKELAAIKPQPRGRRGERGGPGFDLQIGPRWLLAAAYAAGGDVDRAIKASKVPGSSLDSTPIDVVRCLGRAGDPNWEQKLEPSKSDMARFVTLMELSAGFVRGGHFTMAVELERSRSTAMERTAVEMGIGEGLLGHGIGDKYFLSNGRSLGPGQQ